MTTPSSIEQNNQATNAETFLGDTNTASEHDTIQFISAGSQPPLEYDYKGISKLMVDTAADDAHDVKDFLARPVAIGTFDLGSGTTGSDIWSASVLGGIFENETIQRKLANYFAMRCTFCTKLVINSQPYQTGLFYFSQRPYQIITASQGMAYTFPNYNVSLPTDMALTHKTGFPGVLVNISAVSEETIKVPYIGVTPSINLAAAFGNVVAMTTVVPLQQNDSGPHAYATVYAWLEDVELIGTDPYPAKSSWALTPQGGKHVEKLIKGMAPSQSAEAEKGPVSKVADTVGGIAKTLSRIPVVADIAGPVSWACDAVSGLGSIFGFSKPNDTNQAEPVVQDPFRGMMNADMPSLAAKMTLTRHAEIASDSLGPTDKDEMNVVEVASRPCVFSTFGWSTDQARGTNIWSAGIYPAAFSHTEHQHQGDKGTKLTIYGYTFLAWVANMFTWWRGGIKLTFAFAASQFHSGRLRFVVTINDDPTATVAFDDPGHYSLIYDLRSGDTFTVEVPYLSYNYWRQNSGSAFEKNVRLTVFVEGQLVADGRASSNVGVAVLPTACDDFAVAVPRTQYCGRLPYRIPIPAPSEDDKTWELVPQGFDTVTTTEQPEETIKMYPSPPEHARVVATTQAIGDPVTSLRTLAKRYSLRTTKTLAEGIWGVFPFQRFAKQNLAAQSYLENIRSCYRFSRGGVRIMFVPDTAATPIFYKLTTVETLQNVGVSKIPYEKGIGKITPDNNRDFFSIPSICDYVVRFDLKGNAEIEIPYYSQYAMLDNIPVDDVDEVDLNTLPITSATNVVLIWYQPEEATVQYFEAAADDFSTGYLIGTPIEVHAIT